MTPHRKALWLLFTSLSSLGLAFLGLILSTTEGVGQLPYPGVLPGQGLAPLLYVRLTGPKGMQMTWYRGGPKGQTVPAPAVIGLRPGYSVRLQLSGMEGYPELEFFPTLEVRGSLLLPNRTRGIDYPAAVVFSDDDFATVRAGGLVTRVVVLERLEFAQPVASTPEKPIEIQVPAPQDPLAVAHERGRPLLVLRMGQRQLSPEEMAAGGLSGTVLLPGEKVLPPPRFPPWVPWAHFPVFDPVLGMPHPGEEYALPDGGDVGLKAGIRGGRLVGLDPSDTVAEYADSMGRRHVAVSNRVALCVPRYLITRGEIMPATTESRLRTNDTHSITVQTAMQSQQELASHLQNQQLEGMSSRQRLSNTIVEQGTAIVGRLEGVEVAERLHGTANVNGSHQPPQKLLLDKPLKLIKWPDKHGAQVGDIVTFSIRFVNQGERPITNVVVSDSLTPRFEYVQGSAKADRQGHFTIQPNNAGSAVLRWELTDPLLPGESGLVSFQVKVR